MEQLAERDREPDFRTARKEISWFFSTSDVAMGLHGQGFGESSGGGGWDAARSQRAHMTLVSSRRRGERERHDRVSATLGALDPQHRHDLELVYLPFGWGRLSGVTVESKRIANWNVYCRFAVKTSRERSSPDHKATFGRLDAGQRWPGEDEDKDSTLQQLIALALVTPELQVAFARVHPDAEATVGELLRFVATEVKQLHNACIQPGKGFERRHCLAPALHAAERRELAAVTAYNGLRITRTRPEKPSEKLLKDFRIDQEKRDWDEFEARTGVRLGAA